MDKKFPLRVQPEGLYCSEGDFYIDAWKPVKLSLITHAHADHARVGHNNYIASDDSKEILEKRLGSISLECVPYGKKIKIGQCWISFHPAGHVLGSSQIRIETSRSVTVVSGDYKRSYDASCAPFEPLECDFFITESTFALPIYHWQDSQSIAQQIFEWWEENKIQNRASILFCYSLGKAQRILSLLASLTNQPALLHGAIMPISQIYKQKGIHLLPFEAVSDKEKSYSFNKDLILAPPSAAGSPWLKRFSSFSTALASGWMQVRGTRKRKNMDRGFVLSDHADWPDLIKTIQETKATKVFTTHGNASVLAKYLRENLNIHSEELKGYIDISEEED